MAVVTATPLPTCAGQPLATSTSHSVSQKQVSDEEALLADFIPAEDLSAVQISAHRILVTAGIVDGARALPFSILRYLDLDASPTEPPVWTKPLSLRNAKGRRKPAIPVSRRAHTLTKDPTANRLYLIGGLKLGGGAKDSPCKSLFVFDIARQLWQNIDLPQARANSKADRADFIGTRFAHVAVYVASSSEMARTRRRTKPPSILVHGGYATTEEERPSADVHSFDLKTQRWSLCPTKGIGAKPPARAYHAACLSPSGRYLVSHGGNVSDYYDQLNITGDLHVYDIRDGTWAVPKLRSDSHAQPSPRRRHTMVQGVGTHQGLLVLYGGQLGLGGFSDDFFTLRIIDAARPGDSVLAVWQKFQLRSSVPTPPPDVLDAEGNVTGVSDLASAGGCLVPIGEQNRYLLIGGRGEYGVRDCPLLLDADASESMNLADSHNSPKRNTSLGASAQKPPIMVTLSLKKGEPTSPLSLERNGTKTDEEVLPKKEHKAESVFGRDRTPESHIKAEGLPSPDFSHMGPNVSSFQPTPTTDRSPTPVEVLPLKNLSKLIVDGVALPRDGAQGSEKPGTKVRNTTAAKVGAVNAKRSRPGSTTRSAPKADVVLDSDSDDDVFLLPPVQKEVADADNLVAVHSPPRKRPKRTLAREASAARDVIPLDDFENDDDEPLVIGKDISKLPDSAGSSDFMPASAYARKAQSRVAKAGKGRGRGRGRPRGRPPGRTTAQTVAEAREAQKEKEAEEALSLENARLVKQLTTENAKLKAENEKVNQDNQDLNKQMSVLLVEVRTLRNETASLSCKDKEVSASLSLNPKHPSESFGELPNTDGVKVGGITPAPMEPGKSAASEELTALRSRTADLEEECLEITSERDTLSRTLKEAEELKRVVEFELNKAKNKIEALETDRDGMRKQVMEFQKVAVDASDASEVAHKHRTRTEEQNALLKRELENGQAEYRELLARRTEDELHVAAAVRETAAVRAQLAEVQRRNEQSNSKESQLQGNLNSQQSRVDELQKVLDDAVKKKEACEEKNIALLAEVESLKTEFSKKLKECNASIQEADKSRHLLDRERKGGADIKLEQNRLSRELQRVTKEYSALKASLEKSDAAFQMLLPSLKRVTGEIVAQVESRRDLALRPAVPSPVDGEGVVLRNALGAPDGAVEGDGKEDGNRQTGEAGGDVAIVGAAIGASVLGIGKAIVGMERNGSADGSPAKDKSDAEHTPKKPTDQLRIPASDDEDVEDVDNVDEP